MSSVLDPGKNFAALSIKDLLYARDLYHYHLMNKVHVVGTAIGRYLIRDDDLVRDPETSLPRYKDPRANPSSSPVPNKPKRTLENSRVQSDSWPCVLAFVDHWEEAERFGTRAGELHPQEMVPRTLYLPDGRIVPVCVVEVTPVAQEQAEVLPDWHWPESFFGGGMPILVKNQGRDRVATAGCLVSDAHTLYALTSRHVVGDETEPVFTLARGREIEIGRGSLHRLTRLPFEEVYPGFPGSKTFVNLDVGLIQLSDANSWTSSIFGLGRLGRLADLNQLNITLRLIDAPVTGAGAASGRMEGTIKALFYRYKSIGGYDYVSDFLIAPQSLQDSAGSRPGDSGTVWCLQETAAEDESRAAGDSEDGASTLRPLAIQWGGQVFLGARGMDRTTFALATSLTTVCQHLDVEVILGHNTGAVPFWGQLGHYSIAAFALKCIANQKLADLMTANADRISFTVAGLDPKVIKDRLKEAKDNDDLVPLADVPDIVWKNFPSKVKGGRDNQSAGLGRSTGPEHPGHYADIDVPRSSDHATLRELCLADPANLSPAIWKSFYVSTGKTKVLAQGLLPFKVWQFYKALVGFAAAKDVDSFVCAAGMLSHYVGDACQPLHGSQFADGFADQEIEVTHTKRTGEVVTEKSHVGAGVHSTYETKMVDRHSTDLVPGIEAAIAQDSQLGGPAIGGGRDAAAAIIALMDRTALRLDPKTIVDAYLAAGGKNVVAVQDALWNDFGDETIETMADGARVLAAIWDAAWTAGNGGAISSAALAACDPQALIALYRDTTFVESLDLDHIGAAL